MAIKSAKDLYKDRDKLASQSRIRSARDRVSEEDLKKFYDTVQGNINYWMDVGNSFVDSTNSYYKNLDTSSYGLNSSNLWKNSATARNNWLTKEADNIDKILTEYGRYFDSDWISSVRSAMSNVKNASSSILKQADKDIEYWQSWDEVAKKSGMTAEEAYKNAYFTNKYKDYSYEDILKASDEIRNGGKKVKGELSWLVDNADNFMSAKEAQAEIDAISKEFGLDDMNWFEKANDKVQDFFRGLVGAEDPQYGWAQDRIAKLTTIKANAERKEKFDSMVAEAKGDAGYNDYIKKGKAEGQNRDDHWEGLSYNVAYASDIIAVKEGKATASGDGFYQKFINAMDEEQYNNYVYFFGKYGKDVADEYLRGIETEINEKEGQRIKELVDVPLIDDLFHITANFERWASDIGSIFSDEYKAPSAIQIADQMRGAEKEGISKVLWDLEGNIAYQIPSMLGGKVASAILGPAGFGVMGATTAGMVGQLGLTGLSSFSGAKQEMLNLGYSEGQAFTYGALTAASEVGLGALLGKIGNVTGIWTDDTIKRFTKGINSAGVKFAIEFGAGMASEGLEEALQEILEPVFMQITTGKKAEDIDWGQVAYAGMLGALSAGVLNGLGAVKTRHKEKSLANDIKSKEGWVDSVKSLGNTFAADTLAYKLASKVNEKTSVGQLASIIHEMHGTLSEQNVSDIKYQLERNGVLSKDAQTIAEWLGKAVDGENLTALQRKALDNNPIISKVFKDVIINKNSTVNQRLQAIMDLEGVEEHAGVDLDAVAKSQSNEGLSKSATFHQFVEGAKKDAIKYKYNIGRPTYGNYDATLDAMVNKTKEAKANAKINESGVTTNTKTGKQISIKRVTETDGKTATYVLADGTTISNKDVEYSDVDEGLLYEGAISLGNGMADVTNAIIHGIKGVDLPVIAYLNGVDEAIEYGRIGYPMDKISSEGFFAGLPKSMQTYAYNLGRETAKADVEKAQARIDANKGKVEVSRKGEVVKLYEKSGLTSRQEASIDTLGKVVSDITHNKVYIFDTVEKVINGKKVRVFAKDTAGFKAGTPADNGFINKATGEVYIDLHAGTNGEGVIIWTLAHELTHFVRLWSPAKFNVLADFLMAEYGKQGVDVKELIDTKIANSKRKNLSRDEAYEEVVADAMQTMFTDTDLASKLEKLKNKDKGLWNKIKQFFADLYKRVKGEYKNISAQTEEAQKVREMSKDTIERISNLFAEGIVDAGNTYANLDIEAVASGEVDIDGNKSTHIMSIRSMVEGVGLSFEYDEKTGQMRVLDVYEGTEVTSVTKEQVKDSPLGNIVSLAKQNGFISDAEANKQYGFLADLVNLCLNYKENFTMVWEIAGTQVFSAIKANSDTQYGKTIDFSTVCKKTQQVINVISETQKRLKRGLTKDEIKNIVYYETGKAGEPTPCPVCYVFSRWVGIGGILQQMSDFQKKYEGATEEDMRNFINDVESEIVKYANTPNKKGEVKKAFFDKNGKVKFGSVIADLKSKANSKIKSANIRLKIQETETLLAKADLKDKAKLQKTLNRLNAKLAKDGDILDARLKEAEALMSRYEEYQWLTKTYMDEVKAEDGSHIGWKRDENFKPVDEDVLWDLREGARFATEFPKSWLYRTTKGCNAGKAILPYSDARVGETIQGVAYADVKDILTGEHNAFLNGDVKAQADYMTKAIKKQLAQNLIGGMRYQSTSDFRYEYGSDYLITFLEMQAIGAKVQLYTKVIEAVDFLCTVGAEVNLSVMPLNNGYIELEDGRKQLVFSSVTGINAEAAIAKSKQYDNAQLILVGISDEHIRLALEGDDVNGDVVTFVIPFHGSGNTVKAIQELMDLLGEKLNETKAQDYSLVQTDHFAKNRTAEQIALWELRKKIISRTYKKGDKSVAWDGVLTTAEEALLNGPNGSKYLKDLYNRFYVDKSADEYGVSLSTAQAEQIFPYEYWDKSLTYAEADMNGERFKEYCATMGIVPRFSGVDSSGKALGYGDFTNTKGYWKLLIDRKMYNNDGTYHSPKQINVTNFKAETLDPAWGSATYGDVMQKDTNPKKTNAITENVIRQIEGKAKDNFMFSVRNIVGASGTDYGIGVYLDSTLLSNLTETERIEMVKEYVKELGGKQFSAFDKNGDKVNISIAESNKRFKNKQGKRVPINKDLTEKYIKNEVKQESIALVDELILASSYDAQKPPLYPHDWVDNNGQNDWEYLVTYVQDKENTIWEATLNIATTANGEKILYDINPIKKVEQSVESDTSTTLEVEGVETIDTTSTDNRIAQDSNLVNSSEEFSFSERIEAPPTKTEKAYKLMRLVDGKLYPLFIGNNEEVSVGTWYNADSPNLSQLKNLAPGTHLVDMKTGEAMTWDEYAEKHVPKKNGKPTRSKPNIDDVHWANDNGYRFMYIEEKAGGKSESRMLKQYGDTRAYYNWGVNGSSKSESGEGSASLYALRPGWHFGEVPTMHQIGYDGVDGDTVRLDNQVWVEVEMSADVDYNAEAASNWGGDIPTHIPTNGYYKFATNPTQKKTKGGNTEADLTKSDWYVAGAFKVNRILSDSEADSIVENYNKTNGKNVPLDYRRNYGRVFNAETMMLEDRVMFSERTDNAIDNRSLLANALESVAQNDVEREWLTKYKSQIESLNEDQNKLAELRAEIQKIRFTKGQDRSKLPALENQAKTLANRISKADKKLLEIEVSKPLKGVLERERAKAYKIGMEKLAEYRRDRAESKALNYYRPRIEKIVSDLHNRLAHPSAKTAIPEVFGANVAKVLMAFDFTTYDSDGNVRPSKKNMSRAEARESLKTLATHLKLNSIENMYGQLDVPTEMVEWIESVATFFEASENLASNGFDVNKMNGEQLKNAYKFLRSLQTAINNVGKYYSNAHYDVKSDATSTMDYVGKLPTERNEAIEKASKMFKWDFASPVTVFDRFGEGGKHVYSMLVKGQSKMAYNVQEILDFVEKAYTEKEAKEWREKLVTVEIGGKKYNVTIEMLMGLHCLLKQEDSRRHILEGGGIRFADVKHKGKVKRFENIFFNEIDAMAVEKALDAFPRAREVAEAMQSFMEKVGSSWGNEVSMIRFGYHAFTTPNYYPIRTVAAGSEYEAQQKRANIYALLNKSFTKERTPGANNAVIVDGIFSVFNNHMAEMALYNAWALPVIDTIKWFNYKENQDIDAKTAEKSVHETFRLAYGTYADEYVRRLLEAINNQMDSGLSEEWGLINMRMVNRVAVAWNVRVALQQPFSVARAYELINPKYVTPLVGKARDIAYEEMLANSGIAKWKSMGYYDVDVSRPLETKVMKNASLADKFTEVGMKAAEDGDSFTWTALWNACKKETAEKNKGISEAELLKKTAERFDDLILRTQVVDSVLTKTPWSRSKKFWHKATSAFMSEPLTSYNTLLRQSDKFERDKALHGIKYAVKNNAKGVAKVTSVFIFSQLLNALITAPLDALRDDDDYETYLEKLLANFKENAFGNLMPWNMLPWISDVADYFMYGRTDRADMAYAVNLIDLGWSIYKLTDNYSYYKLHNTFNKALAVASQTSGFAVSNIFRDAVAMWNAVAGEIGYGELKFQTKADTHTEGYKRMYDAIVSGDEDRAGYLYGQLLSNELDEEKVYNGLVKLISKEVKDGKITDEEAIERMMAIIGITGKVDSEGNAPTENDVYWMIDKWKYQGENGNTEGYSKYDDIFTAMEDGDPTSAVEWHIEDKTKVYLEEARREAEKDGKTFNEVKAKKEAEKKAESAVKSAVTSYWKPKYKEAYEKGDTEEMKRIRYMLKATKLYGTTSDLLDTVKGWLKD